MKSPEREPEPRKKIEIFFSFPRDINTILALKDGELTNPEVINLFLAQELKPKIMVDWRGKKHLVRGWRLLESSDSDSGEKRPLRAYLRIGEDVYAAERNSETYPSFTQESGTRRQLISEKGHCLFKEQWYSLGKIKDKELFKLIEKKQLLTSTGIRVVVE